MEATNSSGIKHILIVEDELAMARALELKLTKEGFHVVVKANGQEGIEHIQQAPVDLVLLDIMMPEVDGWGFLTLLKEKNISVPVLVTSNLSQAEDVARAHDLGAVGFLIKSNKTLAEIVTEVRTTLQV